MSDIGRWGVVDRLAEKYFNLTLYAYIAKNPIIMAKGKSMNYNGIDLSYEVRSDDA